MPNRLTLLASAALLALATPLAAQDTAAPEAPAETAAPEAPAETATPETPAETAAPETPADTAAPAEAAPGPTPEAPAQADTAASPEAPDAPETPEAEAQAAERPGQPYISETHGDWALRCMRAPEGETDPCQLYQLLEDDEGNAVAEVSLLPLGASAQAAAGVTVVVPLETLLTEALTLSIDGGEAARYPFSFCNRAGCVARFGLSAPQLSAFKRGRAGQLRIVPAAAPDQDVTLSMSLTGFTAGFDAVSAAAQ